MIGSEHWGNGRSLTVNTGLGSVTRRPIAMFATARHLMPAKGMTLPFISYGGSSMISIAYGMGMLLALTRERPRAELLASQSEFVPVGRPA